MEDLAKTIMFTTNAIQNGQPTTIQYQTADGSILKTPKIEGQKTGQEFPNICYMTNNLLQTNTTTVNLAQLADDTKCYIQPIGYNYAVVNQMQLAQNGSVAGIATIDGQGRLQVLNKPVTVSTPNTISNISFKCDVCGLMFAHLATLNQHKRIHNQQSVNSDQTDQDQPITVVTQAGPNIVQAQNLVTENGQTLGQIHIVATESLEPAHQMQQTNEITMPTTKTITIEKLKCISCGTQLVGNIKRKTQGHKLLLCDPCHSNESMRANQRAPAQIFVAPDGDVKFEIGELPAGSDGTIETIPLTQVSNNNVIQNVVKTQTHQKQQQQQQQQQQQNQQNNTNSTTTSSTTFAPGHHPVKRRNLASVTKCQKCNGSGVIFIGGNQRHVKSEQPKPFQCNICGGTFSRYSSLWSHKKLHSGEKNYRCQICGLAFAKAVYLKNHSRIHTGEKPYKCQTCGMQFSQSPHLKNHERTHSGEKPYVCEVCDKGFARHATLWNHRRIHTGEKPYKCEICGSAFSQAAHLKNHAKVHSGEKPFKCDICSAAFADRFALKRHRGIHEKYGQTAPRQPAQKPGDQQNGQGTTTLVIAKEEVMDMDDGTQPTEVIISGL